MRLAKNNQHLPISILKLPPKNSLIETPSSNPQYKLYHMAGKKICIEAYRIQIQKFKLFYNLEIYEWRHQTEFPIAKTKYVSIQPNNMQLPHRIELIVFNEHCPIKMNRIYEMTMAQTLYMLKEAMIGFERLFNKFGAFEVMENMIGINQKGSCRVWLNENFGNNSPTKLQGNQQKMVASILQIMEKHCQQSRTTRKFFSKLRQTKTFLSVLKEIDSFVVGSKVLVPNRYILTSSLKQISHRLDTFNPYDKINKNQSASQPNIRLSFKSSKIQKRQSKQDASQINTVKQSNIASEIKRFKSEDKMRIANIMKISDGETAYTRNIKCSNAGYYNSPRAVATEKIPHNSKTQGLKQLEDSTFVIELEDSKDKNKKDKKQLSHSQAVFGMNQPSEKKMTNKNRKLSANINTGDSYFYRFNSPTKKSQFQNFTDQFNSILGNNDSLFPTTPRNKIMEEDEEDKYREEISDNIMKNNGWNAVAGGFMNIPKEMKQSYHEGKEQSAPKLQPRLQKLESIGRRPVAMSILPQQYEDIF